VGEAPSIDRQALRAAFIERRGFWAPPWQAILELAPELLSAYLEFSTVPWRRGALPPRVKELIYLAIDASTTHLHAAGARAHIAAALRQGATAAEVTEVIELVSALGMQTAALAAPILVEELAKAGTPVPSQLTARQQQVKDRFVAERGSWSAAWDAVLLLDPDFLDAYRAFAGVPWAAGVLEPKTKELVCLAVDASTTHLHEEGTRAHLRAALRYGATAAEVLEVIELTSVLGIHSATLAMPILLDELAHAAARPDAATPDEPPASKDGPQRPPGAGS
jgi:alkylhydroperoxidase/carboxymuconolactone decarboxylase family protein YurZ